MPDERTLVLVEDISFTGRLETEAKKLGGGLKEKMSSEQAALFVLPTKSKAYDFIFVAEQHGYRATIQKALFPGVFSPLDALREDADRIRRALKKPPARPPWA